MKTNSFQGFQSTAIALPKPSSAPAPRLTLLYAVVLPKAVQYATVQFAFVVCQVWRLEDPAALAQCVYELSKVGPIPEDARQSACALAPVDRARLEY